MVRDNIDYRYPDPQKRMVGRDRMSDHDWGILARRKGDGWEGIALRINCRPFIFGRSLWEHIRYGFWLRRTKDGSEFISPPGTVNHDNRTVRQRLSGLLRFYIDGSSNDGMDHYYVNDRIADPIIFSWVYVLDEEKLIMNIFHSQFIPTFSGKQKWGFALIANIYLERAEPDWTEIEWRSGIAN